MSASFVSMSERPWRLLLDGFAPGSWNMAVDEVLLDGVQSGQPPTLRFYGWLPACLSLGYFQAFEVVDVDGCRRQGVDIVRRPTGGRAILHDRELTYSLSLPARVLGQDAAILPSYSRISRALRAGLAQLGVSTTMAPESAASGVAEHGPICFDRPSAHEILLQGRKLVGSAQVRRGDALLQHGSILIEPGIKRLIACLRGHESSRPDAAELASSVIGLAEIGLSDRERLAEAIGAAVEREFGIELESGPLLAEEVRAARQLATAKYQAAAWTERPLDVARDTTRTR
jgi:lipoyl(octanoyl) transferase